MNTITYDDIEITWHPFGLTISAIVTDAYNSAPWVETLQIMPWNECQSQWHIEGECDCPPDSHYLENYREHLEKNHLRLITWPEMED